MKLTPTLLRVENDRPLSRREDAAFLRLLQRAVAMGAEKGGAGEGETP